MQRATQAVCTAACIAACLGLTAACDDGGLQGAKAEVKKTNINLSLPEVPEFKMPEPYPDGSHSVRELQVKGSKLFETELKVKGYVLWIYDCLAHRRKPDQTEKQALKMIADDPSMCDRPHFYMGDKADTPTDKGILVADVPRPLRKDEKRGLTRQELAALPPVPRIAVGDEVVVTGTWATQSPGGFNNSDGLLVYKALEHLSADSPAGGDE